MLAMGSVAREDFAYIEQESKKAGICLAGVTSPFCTDQGVARAVGLEPYSSPPLTRPSLASVLRPPAALQQALPPTAAQLQALRRPLPAGATTWTVSRRRRSTRSCCHRRPLPIHNKASSPSGAFERAALPPPAAPHAGATTVTVSRRRFTAAALPLPSALM